MKIPENKKDGNGKQFMLSTRFGFDTLRNIKDSEHMQELLNGFGSYIKCLSSRISNISRSVTHVTMVSSTGGWRVYDVTSQPND